MFKNREFEEKLFIIIYSDLAFVCLSIVDYYLLHVSWNHQANVEETAGTSWRDLMDIKNVLGAGKRS